MTEREPDTCKTDPQWQAPMDPGVWAKQGGKGLKCDAGNTGDGLWCEAVLDATIRSQPTACQMTMQAAR